MAAAMSYLSRVVVMLLHRKVSLVQMIDIV